MRKGRIASLVLSELVWALETGVARIQPTPHSNIVVVRTNLASGIMMGSGLVDGDSLSVAPHARQLHGKREGDWTIVSFGIVGSDVCYLALRQLPLRPYEMTRVAAGIAQEVVLVVRFRLPEVARWNNFGHDLAWPQAGSIDVGNRVFRDPLLLFAGVEDCRSIAAADVVALAVARARVVDLEEDLEKLPITDARRVEDDLQRFGVVAVI